MGKVNGTGVEPSRKYPEIRKRIEQLGQLNDQHIDALNNRDRKALRGIAKAYRKIGCPRMAEEIRDEAKGIRKKRRVSGYASGAKQSTITGATA